MRYTYHKKRKKRSCSINPGIFANPDMSKMFIKQNVQ